MKLPLLLGAALLFWGWQTGLLPLAIILGIALESHRMVRQKMDIASTSWNHVVDLCTIILLGVLIAGILNDKSRFVFDMGKFLPLILFPLMAAQCYSTTGKVELSALSLITRRQKAKQLTQLHPADITYPYLLATLLAAGMGNTTDGSYYPGIVLLGLWAIIPPRSRAFPLPLWLALMLTAATLGYCGHVGLYRLQEMVFELAGRLYERDSDPFKTTTSIGDIGIQKLHDRIIFRVQADHGDTPILLREATYNTFRSPDWFALKVDQREVHARTRNEKWELSIGDATTPIHMLQIQSKLKKGRANLKLPSGTFRLENLPSGTLQTNMLGSVTLVQNQPCLANYRALFSPEASSETPPTLWDLEIPGSEREAVLQVVNQLHLLGKEPIQILSTLQTYFQTQFGYSLSHQGKGNRNTPLENFLLERKAGQCEYFATATVLMLRACKIPARYAIGYVATEYSPLEQRLIVRQRHAHAWTRVFIDGQWQDFDTTSPNWLEYENANQSPFQFIADFGAFISIKLSEFRWSEKHYMEKTAAGLMVILILIIANRLRQQKRNQRSNKPLKAKKVKAKRLPLSSMQRLEQQLSDRGYPRNPGEPLTLWAKRIRQAAPDLLDYNDLHEVIRWHYRLRFSAEQEEAGRDQRRYDELLNGLKSTLSENR